MNFISDFMTPNFSAGGASGAKLDITKIIIQLSKNFFKNQNSTPKLKRISSELIVMQTMNFSLVLI